MGNFAVKVFEVEDLGGVARATYVWLGCRSLAGGVADANGNADAETWATWDPLLDGCVSGANAACFSVSAAARM